jgi:hypothetical protein
MIDVSINLPNPDTTYVIVVSLLDAGGNVKASDSVAVSTSDGPIFPTLVGGNGGF